MNFARRELGCQNAQTIYHLILILSQSWSSLARGVCFMIDVELFTTLHSVSKTLFNDREYVKNNESFPRTHF